MFASKIQQEAGIHVVSWPIIIILLNHNSLSCKQDESVCTQTLVVPTVVCRVNPTQGQVELSLRLSHTDPAAAKRERRRADRERGKEGGGGTKIGASSDGASAETDRYSVLVIE